MVSCAPLKSLSVEKPRRDPFSRAYAVPFKDFHPLVNQALQKYAQEKPGNFFQIARLGNDSFILRGFYQKDSNQVRFPVVNIVQPVGLEKTRLDIKVSPDRPWTSVDSIEAAAGELFHLIEEETALPPSE